MNVLLFATNADCMAACELIDANLRTNAVNAGYTLDDDGNIIGKDSEGNDQPQAQPTTCWDTPHEVGEGTVTAEGGPYTDWIFDPRPRLGDDVMQGVTGWTEGDYQYPVNPDEI